MAHHHHGRFEQTHGSQIVNDLHTVSSSAEMTATADDDLVADIDEPPDERPFMASSSLSAPELARPSDDIKKFARVAPTRLDQKTSLLSQALAPVPDPIKSITAPSSGEAFHTTSAGYLSAASTADLTSDGGLTSPARSNTPSPPLPDSNITGPWQPLSKAALQLALSLHDGQERTLAPSTRSDEAMTTHQPSSRPSTQTSDAGSQRDIPLVGRYNLTSAVDHPAMIEPHIPTKTDDAPPQEPPKRKCALRFACPFRNVAETAHPTVPPTKSPRPVSETSTCSSIVPFRRWDSTSACKSAATTDVGLRDVGDAARSGSRSMDRARVEASRFHEFASSLEEDEWIIDDAMKGGKLTVDDIFQKEKTIRALGEEVEEEALAEERAGKSGHRSDDGSDEPESDEDVVDEDEADRGDESDDEEGFASSDGDSDDDHDSQSSFWTFRRSTAVTSAEQSAHSDQPSLRNPIRSLDRSPSKTVSLCDLPKREGPIETPPHISHHTAVQSTLLPDSTDFVCGTLDEDRPMEDEFASRLAERKRFAQNTIPQDIDPSFPTSDLDEVDVEDEGQVASMGSHGLPLAKAEADEVSDSPRTHHRTISKLDPKAVRSSAVRLHSPRPIQRGRLARSPPPARRVNETSPQRRRRQCSPAPARLAMAESSRESSASVSLKDSTHPPPPPYLLLGLTRMRSLPQAPNPYYQQYITNLHGLAENGGEKSRGSSRSGDRRTKKVIHRRGAIDIVSGLEKKRQRRREKAWLKYCQRAAKGKGRKPMPGEGVERMRELGLEMAGKNKGGGCCVGAGLVPYILSI